MPCPTRRPCPCLAVDASRPHRSWQAAGKGPKVSGAASASLKDGRVLLWGGLDEARNAVDSLYAFEDGAWTPVETTGFKPPKAMYAAAATQSLVGTSGKEEFVVCGGLDQRTNQFRGASPDLTHLLTHWLVCAQAGTRARRARAGLLVMPCTRST